MSDLSERLGLAKGTTHGLLRTLQSEGFVEQDPETGKYQLGAALLQLGNSYLDVNELRARSIAWSDRLAANSGEAVRVGTLHGAGVIIIHHVFRMDNTLQIPEVGAHLPLHATSLGKVLLAHHPHVADDLLADGLTRLTHATVVSPTALRRVLESVRERGWAAEREEAIIGEASIASPVFDRAGGAAGAVGIVGPVERLYTRRQPRATLVAHVREAARSISRELGGGFRLQ